jgi:hypothetical protein
LTSTKDAVVRRPVAAFLVTGATEGRAGVEDLGRSIPGSDVARLLILSGVVVVAASILIVDQRSVRAPPGSR